MRKKGFTIIEIIAVIIILGVILIIAVPSVTSVIDLGYQKSYEIDLESLITGAKSYVLHKNMEIPSGEQTVITTSQMIEIGVLDEIIDPQTNEVCEGYVTIIPTEIDNDNYKFTPYLKCGDNYISDNYGQADLGLPVITLFGENPTGINTGALYFDAGAIAYDETDGDISDKIVVSASINPNKPGEYQVVYNVKDKNGNAAIPVVRTVYVVDKSVPIITMLGSNPVTLDGVTTYTDAGATALDDADGDLTSKITVTSNVNTNAIGTYTVKYEVKDNSNNAAVPKIRTVNVTDTKYPTMFAKGPSYTITEGDSHDIASTYFTANKNGILNISSTSCVDLTNNNLAVTNTSSLVYGTHTIKCSVTKQNALSAEATVSIIVNPSYIGLPSKTYNNGSSVTYGGIEWLVVSDNGGTVTLISKNNVTTSAFGSSNNWSTSTANTYLNNTWLNNNSTLLSETQKGGIIYDQTSSSYVRLITKNELKSSLVNGSGTNFWTMTTSGNNVYYALTNASMTYTKYTVSSNASNTCYSGSSSSLSSITSNYTYNTLTSPTVETIAAPSVSTAEKSTSYETAASGSGYSTYATGSSPYYYDCNCSSYACGCYDYSCPSVSYSPVVVPVGNNCVSWACAGQACAGQACAGYGCDGSACAGQACAGYGCAGSACSKSTCVGQATASSCASYSNSCRVSNVCTSYIGTNCMGSSARESCSNICARYTTFTTCGYSTCAGYSCTKSTCTKSTCTKSTCTKSTCSKSTCTKSTCTGSICAAWSTSYSTYTSTSTTYNTCTTCSSTCQSCSTCTGYTTTYSASGSAVNWARYVVSSQTSSMGVRAVITVKKK